MKDHRQWQSHGMPPTGPAQVASLLLSGWESCNFQVSVNYHLHLALNECKGMRRRCCFLLSWAPGFCHHCACIKFVGFRCATRPQDMSADC